MKIPINTVRALALIAGLSLAMSSKATVAVSDLPDFDNLPNFGLLGNNLSSALSSVNGNVGVSDGGTLTGPGTFTVNGNLSVGEGASTTVPIHVIGSTDTGVDLSLEQATVFSASEALSALPFDTEVNTLETGPLSFNVPAGQIYVLNLNGGLDLSGGNGISVTGGGGLVINIADSFAMSAGSSITGPPSNVFINYTGSSADLLTALIDGQIFVPNAATTLSGGAVFGGVFTGDGNTDLSLGQVINAVPVPEPGILALAAIGGISTIILRRRFCSLTRSV